MGHTRDEGGRAKLCHPQAVDDALALLASEALPLTAPEQSAKTGLTAAQSRVFGRLAAVFGIAGLTAPDVMVVVLWFLGLIACALLILWRAGLVFVGAVLRHVRGRMETIDTDLAPPTYTLLIPLYREAAVARQLAAAIGRLDYPEDRLDVKLLVETGDDETLHALQQQSWPTGTEILVAPPGIPRTKPRALNYGLQRARGALLTIYDAEDRPHTAQLRAAAAAFAKGGSSLACVQAPLRADTKGRNWIARHWALEYAVQFGLLMPALAALQLPILLGGTSNHFRTDMLRKIGGWDAWNVTEDADLGLRLARSGGRVATIRPPTLEEPPHTLNVWAAQRSRWIKGFMQTWLVLMRRPKRAIAEMGLLSFLSVQLGLGGAVLAAMLHGPALMMVIIGILMGNPPTGIALILIVSGYGLYGLGAALAPGARLQAVGTALTAPIYWPLHSTAAMRAVYGCLKDPHFWAKTPHGPTPNLGGAPACSTGSSQDLPSPVVSDLPSSQTGKPANPGMT
ncbi:MAG: glycosyltransferase [Pseudomonadota bacterium]